MVLIARGADRRDPAIFGLEKATFAAADLSDVGELARAFAGCEAVAHCAGINREIGAQTYERVHIAGTLNVCEAARSAGVRKIVMLSFLRARPNCGSGYHESKFAAEEIVRNSGLDYTVLKAGVIYGLGDHMLDHLSHAFYTFPVFALVGFKAQPVRPLAVEDLARVMEVSLSDERLVRKTVAITGPEEILFPELVRRVAAAAGKNPLVFRSPLAFHYTLAWFAERSMKVPLTALAQVRILSESLTKPLPPCSAIPCDLLPQTMFTQEQIRKGLPEPGRFGWKDLRWARGEQ